MEKIHQPARDVGIFTLYGGGLSHADGLGGDGRDRRNGQDGPARRHLVLRWGRKAPLLFLAAHRVTAGAQPPAPVMRLRKHLSGRHITRGLCHWTERRLYLETSGGATLLLDLREGPRLLFEPAPPFQEPAWPDMSDISGMSGASDSSGASGASGSTGPAPRVTEGDEGWRRWPALTPALRRVLPLLEPEEGRALLMDLEAGGGDVFLYEGPAGERRVSAWPLPAMPDGAARATDAEAPAWRESVWDNPLPALALAGESQVYAALADSARRTAARPFVAEIRRLDALLARLDDEEIRLAAMRDRQADALLLQANLYRLDRNRKLSSLILPVPPEAGGSGGTRELILDPRLSPRDNMAALFHQAARGRRGLEHLARRRAAVLAERDAALSALTRSQAALSGAAGASQAGAAGQRRREGLSGAALPGRVQAFRSSDGFALLRGRDSRGNALALRLAAPHDYWLHTADGPGAHVIIRRDHAGHEVPERTLREAGALAALKSPLRDAAWADIQYSLVKYIHPMKNAGPGMVRIDRSEGSFRVSPDPGLEERLSLPDRPVREETSARNPARKK